jgi:lipopolysaccharide export system protein LptA
VPGAFGKLSEAGLSANPSGPKPVEADESVEVSSDDFEFASETKVAVWRGNVRAKDPKLNLTCELLTAKLASGDQGKPASQGGKLESIVAETNVVMTITETNGVTTARADKAVYSAQNETLVLSAKEVMLESASARLQMWSPSITMGLTNKMLKATAPVRTKLPSGAFGKMGDVGLNPRPGDARPAGVEETIEVLADSFEFTAQPKLAIWRENVRAKDPKLDLRCELLTANLASEGGKLQSVVAEVNVVVTITETNGVTTARGDKAFYSAEGETLVLSGKDPTVKSDSPKFELWSAEITYDLKNRTIHPKPPLRGSILPSAFGKLKENKSSHSPTERKPAEVKK